MKRRNLLDAALGMLATRRFNHIDAFGMSLTAVLLSNDRWGWAAASAVLFSVLSLTAEAKHAQ